MPQQTVFLPQIGEVTLSKRKGTRHLRLSINAAGKVRVGMPYFTPYQVGISFAKSKAGWIQKHLATQANYKLQNGDLIGKSHRINYVYQPSATQIATRIKNNQVTVTTSLSIHDNRVQTKLQAACERALKVEALNLLPMRLKFLAKKHGFTYKDVSIRKLTARWGSCSNHGNITLSYYLVQLPWDLIDYVLLHELTHTKHLHHGPDFWAEFKRVLPNAKTLQKQIRAYRPLVQAYGILPNK